VEMTGIVLNAPASLMPIGFSLHHYRECRTPPRLASRTSEVTGLLIRSWELRLVDLKPFRQFLQTEPVPNSSEVAKASD